VGTERVDGETGGETGDRAEHDQPLRAAQCGKKAHGRQAT
jgi:hypothetical protein